MCDATELIKKLQPLQVKPKELKCTASTTCWCNSISHRFPHSTMFEGCMSPREMLELDGKNMSEHDRKYLESLVHKAFNPNP